MANFFPRWTNILPLKIAVCLGVAGAGVVVGFTYYATPKAQRVGYMPAQPIPYDHSLHVNQLGMDCRYCHNMVEESWYSNIPSADTCMKCHSEVLKDDPRLAPVRESAKTGKPIPWVQIHKTPDYVYFNHSVHVTRGISCVKCHGRVDQMDEVHHAKSMSMAFCLECHRNVHENIRPLDKVTDLAWDGGNDFVPEHEGRALEKRLDVRASENCSACHR